MNVSIGDKVNIRLCDLEEAFRSYIAEHGDNHKVEGDLIEVIPQDNDEEDMYVCNVKIPRIAMLGSEIILPARRARK